MKSTVLMVPPNSWEINNNTGYVIGAIIALIILVYLIYSLIKIDKL
jgi:hypothetical protein